MTPERVSVVVPVKDGARYLEEVLAAVRGQGEGVELLVIDSGSRDGSVGLARAAEAEVLEIAPGEFGHGRTRNLAMERTSGELVCFLTQDATPMAGWLAAHREAMDLDPRVGAAFGPHRPRGDTSPMIARELTEFFRGFAPDGLPVLQRSGEEPFLSNVNACYRRSCWAEVRFRDLPYAEDQAFGRDMLAAGWLKAYLPAAAVLHAHDYGTLEFLRRYFDEYRGLLEATGHVEPIGVRSWAREVRALVAHDRRWMRAEGFARRERAEWTARSAAHHGGRKLAAALGSRAPRLPAPVQAALSLERRSGARGGRGSAAPRGDARSSVAASAAAAATLEPGASAAPVGRRIEPLVSVTPYQALARVMRGEQAPLLDPVPGMADRNPLHIAIVVPPFQRGSGGHNTLFQLATGLERLGHSVSIWLDDPAGFHAAEWPGVIRGAIREHFTPFAGPVFRNYESWYGADVVVATGWQTVHPVLLLEGCRARAYVVNDHEPEFYGTSVQAWAAASTYKLGLHPISASPWLRDQLAGRYGAPGDHFQLGVDHQTYWPRPVERRRDTLIYYARASTSRRAVEIGTLALEEMLRRRPELRVLLYGDPTPPNLTFPYEHLGIISPEQLAWAYSEATVGLSLSLTNFSLIPKEMLACGLPCVELAGVSAESIFGPDDPISLAPLDPVALADAIEELLADPAARAARSAAGIEWVAGHTWEVATRQVEAGLRHALREREALLESLTPVSGIG